MRPPPQRRGRGPLHLGRPRYAGGDPALGAPGARGHGPRGDADVADRDTPREGGAGAPEQARLHGEEGGRGGAPGRRAEELPRVRVHAGGEIGGDHGQPRGPHPGQHGPQVAPHGAIEAGPEHRVHQEGAVPQGGRRGPEAGSVGGVVDGDPEGEDRTEIPAGIGILGEGHCGGGEEDPHLDPTEREVPGGHQPVPAVVPPGRHDGHRGPSVTSCFALSYIGKSPPGVLHQESRRKAQELHGAAVRGPDLGP